MEAEDVRSDWRLKFYLRNARGLVQGPHTQGKRYTGWQAAAFSS